tara:strand:- start:785 stop:1813 length:1029 start_codon:yes stop_codon:yes gene_type:complete
MQLDKSTLRMMILKEIKNRVEKKNLFEQTYSQRSEVTSDERKQEIRAIFSDIDWASDSQNILDLKEYMLDAEMQNALDDGFVRNIKKVLDDAGIDIEENTYDYEGPAEPTGPIGIMSVEDARRVADDQLADVASGSAVVKRGAKGPRVEVIQRLVYDFLDRYLPTGENPTDYLGTGGEYNVGIDGDFGPSTEEAIEKVQEIANFQIGLKWMQIDGEVGQQTLDLITHPHDLTFDDPSYVPSAAPDEAPTLVSAEMGPEEVRYYNDVDGKTWIKIIDSGNISFGELVVDDNSGAAVVQNLVGGPQGVEIGGAGSGENLTTITDEEWQRMTDTDLQNISISMAY